MFELPTSQVDLWHQGAMLRYQLETGEKSSSNEDQTHAARSIESVLSSLKDALNAAQYFSIDSEEDEDNGSVAIYGKNIMHSNKKKYTSGPPGAL